MKTNLKIASVLCLLLIGQQAFAQNRVGNGGDGILCEKEGEKPKAELLDFYESSQKRIETEAPYAEVVEARLKALEKVSGGGLGETLLKRWKAMKNEIEWKKDIELVDVQDSKHLFTPSDKNCKLKQIALRRAEAASTQKRFVIDETFWNQMAPVSQAGLLMHELVYEHFFKLGETDSVKARTMNAYVFSPDLESGGPEGYWKLIQSLKIPIYKK
jgi:hypothetical protein